MMNATITVRRSGGVIPAPGIRGAFGGTDSADTAEIVIDLSNDGDVEEMHISGLFDPAARALNVIGAAEEPEDEVEAEVAPQEEPTPESRETQPEPVAGDAWALQFKDRTGAIYIFDGIHFIHPKHPDGIRSKTSYAPGDAIIASAKLVAAASEYDAYARGSKF